MTTVIESVAVCVVVCTCGVYVAYQLAWLLSPALLPRVHRRTSPEVPSLSLPFVGPAPCVVNLPHPGALSTTPTRYKYPMSVLLMFTGPGLYVADPPAAQVLIMTVEPGFGGQSFMAEKAAKAAVLRKKFPDLLIQVRP